MCGTMDTRSFVPARLPSQAQFFPFHPTIYDRLFVDDLRSVTPNRVLGDPRRATREMGEAPLEYVSDVLADQLRARLR